jgi:hypothetical protein
MGKTRTIKLQRESAGDSPKHFSPSFHFLKDFRTVLMVISQEQHLEKDSGRARQQ